mmetsp:Transcript_70832/g.140399  ORF Transcript_70832/g.140399 Transcript_70832/m.140399 type:complete len:89 (-) Transcript_70832:427-693(-)
MSSEMVVLKSTSTMMSTSVVAWHVVDKKPSLNLFGTMQFDASVGILQSEHRPEPSTLRLFRARIFHVTAFLVALLRMRLPATSTTSVQ